MFRIDNTLQLFINGEEYDFNNNISYEFHPTNFSSITFNNVIKKSNNIFPLNIINFDFNREFSFVEVKNNNETIFNGFINDMGRLSISYNELKTFSIKVSDLRQWLSLKKPINKIYLNRTPLFIIQDLITLLKEPRIQLGDIDFSHLNDEFTIKAYNTTNKNLYQILKEVIPKFTDTLLYFTNKNNILYINYKSEQQLKQPSEIVFDLKNKHFFEKYQILNSEFDSSISDYYNYLTYSSDNVISNDFKTERNLLLNEKTITLTNNVAKINDNIQYTYFENIKTGRRRKPVILNKDKYESWEYYDILWQSNSNQLTLKNTNEFEILTFSYYTISPLSLEAFNEQEIQFLKDHTKTDGIVFKYEKYNDISNQDDLLTIVRNDIKKYSSSNKTLTITCRQFIWELMDSVNVINVNDSIDGFYIVQEMNGKTLISHNQIFHEITYVLKQSKNLDTFLNKFDNQSYRDNPVEDDNLIVENIITLKNSLNILYEDFEEEIIENIYQEGKENNFLQGDLQIDLIGSKEGQLISGKYKELKLGEGD